MEDPPALAILCRDDRKLDSTGTLRSTITFFRCSVRADRYKCMAWNGGHVRRPVSYSLASIRTSAFHTDFRIQNSEYGSLVGVIGLPGTVPHVDSSVSQA